MADRTAEDSGPAGQQPAPSLLEDILGLLPRLADRTSAQIEFTQSVLSMLPCTRALFSSPTGPGDPEQDAAPEHEAKQPIDVLTVLSRDGEEESAQDAPGSDSPSQDPAPGVDELAIPEYDSLAASQVVPRLTTLSTSELEAVGAYEAANRGRRTILNRVTALLAD